MIAAQIARKAVRSGARALNLHECTSAALMNKYGVPTARGVVAETVDEVEQATRQLRDEAGAEDVVVKSQILAGGRGKGTFTTGFQGGVHIAHSPEEARMLGEKMLNKVLVTKQTGPEGKTVSKLFITERLYVRRESYFAILLDRASGGPVMIGSAAGGMDIEAVAEQFPDKIRKEFIDIDNGPTQEQVEALAKTMGFVGKGQLEQCSDLIKNLYKLFRECDATQIEINPLGETSDKRVLALDAKLNFDDNAEFRQKEIFALKDDSQVDPAELEAAEHGLEYVGLDGNIGCMVNGAGLAMATMDAIKLAGGEPRNFLDLGGGAGAEKVAHAFKMLNDDRKVKAILVNIFGGILRCDLIAMGIIRAAETMHISKPVVIRLEGTNVEQAKEMIENSGLRMLTATDLSDAASKAAHVADIVKRSEDIGVTGLHQAMYGGYGAPGAYGYGGYGNPYFGGAQAPVPFQENLSRISMSLSMAAASFSNAMQTCIQIYQAVVMLRSEFGSALSLRSLRRALRRWLRRVLSWLFAYAPSSVSARFGHDPEQAASNVASRLRLADVGLLCCLFFIVLRQLRAATAPLLRARVSSRHLPSQLRHERRRRPVTVLRDSQGRVQRENGRLVVLDRHGNKLRPEFQPDARDRLRVPFGNASSRTVDAGLSLEVEGDNVYLRQRD